MTHTDNTSRLCQHESTIVSKQTVASHRVDANRDASMGRARDAIHVCHAGSCARAGAAAVLLEIEALASDATCDVRASGCLGACGRAPNAHAIRRGGDERLFTRVDDADKSADVVRFVTGRDVDLDAVANGSRLAAARRMRRRRRARDVGKWNAALSGLDEEARDAEKDEWLELRFELAQLCCSAGQCERALEHLGEMETVIGGDHPAVVIERAKALSKLGREKEIKELKSFASNRLVSSQLSVYMREASKVEEAMPRRVDGYALWTLRAVTPVSRHSALYHLTSDDRARGTPFTRGRGRTAWHKTWHTTLLATVGANEEGPLPWIERDYTPVSTWREWEAGHCKLLIKVYRDGRATSWLRQQSIGTRLWLSQPRKTLGVPSLTTDFANLSSSERHHDAIVLVLGGTGVVAAPQVLHHTDQLTCFRTGKAGRAIVPLTSPVSLIYACRHDDVLLLQELTAWCRSAGVAPSGGARLARCTIAVSPAQTRDDEANASSPFTSAPSMMDALDNLRDLPNVRVIQSRVTQELIRGEIAEENVHGKVRVVVSGPEGFNLAMKAMLHVAGVAEDSITILEA